MKNRIKLNEFQLRNIIAESVKNVLKEGQFDDRFAECVKHLNAALGSIKDIDYAEAGFDMDSQYTLQNNRNINKLNRLIVSAIFLAKDLGTNGRDGDFDANGYHSAGF